MEGVRICGLGCAEIASVCVCVWWWWWWWCGGGEMEGEKSAAGSPSGEMDIPVAQPGARERVGLPHRVQAG